MVVGFFGSAIALSTVVGIVNPVHAYQLYTGVDDNNAALLGVLTIGSFGLALRRKKKLQKNDLILKVYLH
ncbi:MAG: LPXTG cell wall anchor domain-containing protein [Cyanobacteria bacterium P01_A01_bin.84]